MSNIRSIERLNYEDLGGFLEIEGIHEDVVSVFANNRISGKIFLQLSEEDLREMVPVIGDRVCVRELRKKVLDTSTPPVHLAATDSSPVASRSSSKTLSPAAIQSSSKSQSTAAIQSSSTSQPSASQSNWHLHFEIPELSSFTGVVKTAIETGIITGLARREIIQVLRTYMTKYTMNPTSEHYQTVCQKLIVKYPNLQDSEGKSLYGSWRISLRNTFKNLRRKNSETEQPPSKRSKIQVDDMQDIDEDEYVEAVQALKEVLKKGGKDKSGKHSEVKDLMDKTRKIRCHWIQEQHPLISEVMQKFPCLAFGKWARREFRAIARFEVDQMS